jgi:hypothetical protein
MNKVYSNYKNQMIIIKRLSKIIRNYSNNLLNKNKNVDYSKQDINRDKQ